VVATPFGRLGGLICWENYMPLARMAMYGKGVDIWLAPTADARDTWQATMRHVAFEGRCFVVGCNQYLTKSMYPADLEGVDDIQYLELLPDEVCEPGRHRRLDPLGNVLAGPLFGQEGIVTRGAGSRACCRGRGSTST
jgi:nitrilase